METVKLQKYFSDCAVMSRRAAEEEIKNGKVTVNGEIAELGLRVDPDKDVVIYKGKRVLPQSNEKIYVLLNKPRGVITSLSDEKGRTTVRSLLSDLKARVYPVGRLDYNSDGLLLLTNDGDLTYKLTHPKHEIPKIYHVTVKGTPSPQALARLRSPLDIDGYIIQPVKTEVIASNDNSTTLKMTLFEGRNRQIRKMCALCDLKIERLTRVSLGNISLGTLKVGKWRYLTDGEIEYLKRESTQKN